MLPAFREAHSPVLSEKKHTRYSKRHTHTTHEARGNSCRIQYMQGTDVMSCMYTCRHRPSLHTRHSLHSVDEALVVRRAQHVALAPVELVLVVPLDGDGEDLRLGEHRAQLLLLLLRLLVLLLAVVGLEGRALVVRLLPLLCERESAARSSERGRV